MNCVQCGTERSLGDERCAACGARVADEQPAPPGARVVYSRTNLVVLGAAIVLGVTIIVGAVTLLRAVLQ